MTEALTRRRFLQAASTLGVATVVGACVDESRPRAAPATTTTGTPTTDTADGTLVVVTLYGGNDALNTVVPVHDPGYAGQRGSLALDPTTTHDIGQGFALHPALQQCKALWDADRLAVVHGVGFPGLDRSHFHCMDVWQTGREDATGPGWIGRWLDLTSTDPLDAIAVSRGLPVLGRGQKRSAAVVPPGPFELPGEGGLRTLLGRLAARADDRSGLADQVATSMADLLAVADTVGPVMDGTATSDTLAARFDTVAALVEAGLPAQVYAVDLDGFDTHADQAASHASLLAQVDSSLGAFLERMGERPVTVLLYSEFGRRVAPNASAGTDHGQAGIALVAGRVRAGHHGEPSPLDRLVDGDLATTVDFRAVYGGLLEGVLGIDAGDVLDRPPAPLRLV